MGGTALGSAARRILVVATVAATALFPAVQTPDRGPAIVAAADVHLLAAEALVMTGTEMHSVDPEWMRLAIDEFIAPTLGGRYTAVPVQTPAEFWPFGGIWDESIDASIAEGTAVLDAAVGAALLRTTDPIVVFGYSQSAVIATRLKQGLVMTGPPYPPISFVLLGNPSRPNGGLFERFVGLQLPGWTMSGPTPTDTPFTTIDVARQYDPFADFPSHPLNLLAVSNALMGLVYAHDYTSVSLDPADPRYQPDTVVQQFGDTTYYLIPAEHLPLLRPLWDFGVAPEILQHVEPTLRALVELGYDRDVPFGQPSPARILPSERTPATRRPAGEPSAPAAAVADRPGKRVAKPGRPAAGQVAPASRRADGATSRATDH